MQALEHFVVDNDDLLQLEERVGRFNIFDALDITRNEVKHSNFLAWLLDPAESHGQGTLFLNAILMDLFKKARGDGMDVPLSPVELDGAELRGVDIRREWRNIDLIIQCDQPRFLVAVENKIYAGEHSNQLARYRKTIEQHFPGWPTLYVFLTREGDEPSDDQWCVYSYGDVHRVLSRVRRTQEKAIGEDVLTFLDHYLNLVERRFMNAPDIAELCRKIYKNHRQALELIYEHVGSPTAGLLIAIEDAIKKDGNWSVINRTNQRVECVPSSWRDFLPPINGRATFDPRQWIFLQVGINRKGCHSLVRVCPTTDTELRKRVIDRLIADPQEFGLNTFFKSSDRIGNWAALGRVQITAWKEEDEPEEEQLVDAASKHLQKRLEQLEKVPGALKPIVAGWKPR